MVVEGRLALTGEKAILVWENGHLDGSPAAVAILEEEARLHEGRIGPVGGPYTDDWEEHLGNPVSFAFLARQIFEKSGLSIVGEPEPEDDPPGTIY